MQFLFLCYRILLNPIKVLLSPVILSQSTSVNISQLHSQHQSTPQSTSHYYITFLLVS
jgi:hypothetical protein